VLFVRNEKLLLSLIAERPDKSLLIGGAMAECIWLLGGGASAE
jgi:hypothetical protein